MKRFFLAVLLTAITAFAQSGDAIPLAATQSLHGLAGTASAITYTVFGANVPGGYGVLAQGKLAATDSVVFAAPQSTTSFLSLVNLANTTGTAVTGVTLAINGTAATAAYIVLPGVTIPAYGSVSFTRQGWQTRDVSGNALQTGTQAFDTVAAAVTTPLAASTAGTSLLASHRDHTHQSPGGCASIVAPVAVINVEAQVVGCTVPAGLMQAGTTFRITAAGTATTADTPGNDVFKVRVGTTTLTGNIAATITAAANASITAGSPFYLEMLVTVRTAGANGTVIGQGVLYGVDATTGAFTAVNIIGITSTAVAVDTTAAKIVQLTAVTAVATSSLNIETAAIEIAKM